MSENNIDYNQYLYNKNYLSNPVWKKFDHGYKDDFFNEEEQKFINQQKTQSCFDETCYDCGVCGDRVKSYHSKLGHQTVEPNTIQDLPKGRFRYKLVFIKKGLFKFISHRDLLPLFEKIFRMLDVPMLYSEGFNKRMRIRLIFPPPLMVEGENELLEFFTWKPVAAEELADNMNRIINQKDLQVKEIKTLSLVEKPLNHSLQFSEYKVICKERQCRETIREYREKEKEIIYHLNTDKEIILTLKQDKSIIKLLNNILETELPELWKHVDKIIRLKIYE